MKTAIFPSFLSKSHTLSHISHIECININWNCVIGGPNICGLHIRTKSDQSHLWSYYPRGACCATAAAALRERAREIGPRVGPARHRFWRKSHQSLELTQNPATRSYFDKSLAKKCAKRSAKCDFGQFWKNAFFNFWTSTLVIEKNFNNKNCSLGPKDFADFKIF